MSRPRDARASERPSGYAAPRTSILVCPTAFKGTLSPGAAAAAMAAGARATAGAARRECTASASPGAGPSAAHTREVVALPLSDGGDGLLECVAALDPGLVLRAARVTGPSGEPVRAHYLTGESRSIVESARACGLALVPRDRRDPLAATSFGVGELVLAAGPRPLVLGLGGSATVDGGAGMARALGWRLLDGAGRSIPPGGGGLRALRRVAPPDAGSADTRGGGRADRAPVVALADVRNPLLGGRGAAWVFAPQKGADADAVAALEEGLAVLAERLRADLGIDVSELPGGGAAGGLGAGAVAFLGARLVAGSAWMLDEAGFDARLARAAVLVTGEGAYDGQSGMGKIVGSVVERAVRAGVPVVVVAGRTDAPEREGVLVRTGGGKTLDAADLARITAGALRELFAAGA